MLSNGDKVANPDDEMERAINTPGPGFMGILQAASSNIRQYTYQNKEEFLDVADHEVNNMDGLFLLTGVTDDIFQSTFLVPEDDDGPFSRWSSYDAELGLLLFNMYESPIHSCVSPNFDRILVEALEQFGLARQLQPVGSALWQSSAGGKKPDFSWRPRGAWMTDQHGWPNTVMEVTFSETQTKLEGDIRWWLHKSRRPDNDPNTVLGVVIDDNAPWITIEKWENDLNGDARLQQRIFIEQDRAANIVTITGSPLVLEFEKLFERPPTPTERDVEIDDEKLEFWARIIWGEEEP
ncbi:hypothetical protein BJY00DRAFT_312133 [Aspergillus carlsbadensis]|nr:hypothetical protein BJY00DRAFT_312133 [Aspergillus carlsbadensis]